MIKVNNVKRKAYPFLYELDIDQDVRRRLTYSLQQVVEGNNEVFTTPLGKDGKADKILLELDKVFKSATTKINGPLRELELSNRAKFGPRSISVPWSIRDKFIYESFEPYKGKDVTNLDCFMAGPKGIALRPISREQALLKLKNNTNSGLPFYTRKSKVKDKAMNQFDKLLDKKYPCILFTRTQESKKTRNVWGFPIANTLLEMMVYIPILDYQRKYAKCRAVLLGPEYVDRALTEMILSAVSTGRILVSIDFGRYDNTVKRKLQDLAWKAFKSVFQRKYHDLIDRIAEIFATIGIVTPDGILKGDHGVPSGSTFTNEVDSKVQEILVRRLPFVSADYMQIQGDDGVYLIPKGREKELFDNFESFGLIVNREKSYTADNYAIYLQNLYHIDYMKDGLIGGIYPIYRALNRICYQERWTDFEDYNIIGKDYYAIRTISILENCKYHPLFEELVKLVYRSDKYSLKFSEQGLRNYMLMMEQTKGLGGIFTNQYGENVKGIKSFESYKIIKSLG